MVSRNRTRRKSRNFAVVGGKRREVLWVPWASATVASTFGTKTVIEADLLGNYFADTGREVPKGATAVRMRGTYSLQQVGAALQQVQIALAVNVVSESDVFAESIISEIISPIWRDDRNFSFRSLETSAGGFSVETKEFPMESRAKRILGNADKLELVSHTILSTGSADVNVTASGAVLLMLP